MQLAIASKFWERGGAVPLWETPQYGFEAAALFWRSVQRYLVFRPFVIFDEAKSPTD